MALTFFQWAYYNRPNTKIDRPSSDAPIQTKISTKQRLETSESGQIKRIFEELPSTYIAASGISHARDDYTKLIKSIETQYKALNFKSEDGEDHKGHYLTDRFKEKIKEFYRYYLPFCCDQLFTRNPTDKSNKLKEEFWEFSNCEKEFKASLEVRHPHELGLYILSAFYTNIFAGGILTDKLNQEIIKSAPNGPQATSEESITLSLFDKYTLLSKYQESLFKQDFLTEIINSYKTNGAQLETIRNYRIDGTLVLHLNTFDEVFNPNNKYTSRRKAFFGYNYPDTSRSSILRYVFTFKWLNIAKNTIKFFTEYLTATLKNYSRMSYHESTNNLNFLNSLHNHVTPLKLYYRGKQIISGFFYGLFTLANEAIKTFTSPWQAAKETFKFVKRNTGNGRVGTVLGFIAGGLRVAGAVVAAVFTLGAPLWPVIGSTLKSAFGSAVGWVTHLFAPKAAAAAASAEVSAFTLPSAAVPVVTTVAGAGLFVGAFNTLKKVGTSIRNLFCAQKKENTVTAEPTDHAATAASRSDPAVAYSSTAITNPRVGAPSASTNTAQSAVVYNPHHPSDRKTSGAAADTTLNDDKKRTYSSQSLICTRPSAARTYSNHSLTFTTRSAASPPSKPSALFDTSPTLNEPDLSNAKPKAF